MRRHIYHHHPSNDDPDDRLNEEIITNMARPSTGDSMDTTIDIQHIDNDENDQNLDYVSTKRIIFQNFSDNICQFYGYALDILCLPEVPAIYQLPDLPSDLVSRIRSCKSSTDAARLKADVSFSKGLTMPIVRDLERYVGEDR